MPIVRALAGQYQHLDRAELQAAGEDAILEAWLTYHSERGASLDTWVRRIIHWRLLELARSSAQPPMESLGEDPQLLNGANPEEQFERSSAVLALSRLSVRQQNVVDGHMRGETYAEIAEQLGISHNLAHREALRAFTALRALLTHGQEPERIEADE